MPPFEPRFNITPGIAGALMRIEAAREAAPSEELATKEISASGRAFDHGHASQSPGDPQGRFDK
jgi:hypothetical protein